jgi:hypothetical protein
VDGSTSIGIDGQLEHNAKRQTAEKDTTTSIEKESHMPYDVVSAVYLGNYRIEIEFDNGERGTVDFAMYLDRPGVFNRFRDLEFFRSFSINRELGVLTWGDEIDIAPETLYSRATGTPLPEWMNPGEEPQKDPQSPIRSRT